MAKSISATKRSGGGASAQSEDKISEMYRGETPYVSFSPTPLHPEGRAIVAQDADGGYRYLGYIPNWTQIPVDRNSSEYRRELRDYNIKFAVHADGSVSVEKGGLYERGKTYKTRSAFIKDAEKRIESRSRYTENEFNARVNGRISQIQAENFKHIVRNNPVSQAASKMKAVMKDNITSLTTRYTAIQDVKRRFREIADRL